MPIKYFKPELLIETVCDHCGVHRKETLARLYSDEMLLCTACGEEHTTDRSELRRVLDETEALIDKVPDWPAKK